MEQGIDYNLTFAPVIAWPSIRLFLTFFAINNWVTRQLDLVLDYPHANITRPTFLRIPRGFRVVKHPTNQRHVLRIIYNLYVQVPHFIGICTIYNRSMHLLLQEQGDLIDVCG